MALNLVTGQLPYAGVFNRDAWRHHRHPVAGLRTLASGTLKPGMNSLSGQFFSGTGRLLDPLTIKEQSSYSGKDHDCTDSPLQKNCSFDVCKQFKLPLSFSRKLKKFKDSA
ncbi:hypothetical protein AVEN_113459-1 [Araneus ventricosus]|uniref:Uncharacterized protein n=1 Tax=Araneus ventricosus TaxID=182803 RepID=A0A4Y2N0X9_ARAVE|nr:hypothetical protein AVEN_113459-1 [Araneus ventricosus]